VGEEGEGAGRRGDVSGVMEWDGHAFST
jgi:hypothetical protein